MNNKKVLCLGVSTEIVEEIQINLKSEGFDFILKGTKRGQESLETIQLEKPALIILDLDTQFQNIDGWEILEQIKNVNVLSDVPVIGLKSKELWKSDPPYRDLSVTSLLDGCVVKPFELEDLVSIVLQMLGG